MLNTKKSITLTGQSKVTFDEKEVTAVQLNATISQNGTSNINTIIINQDAYDTNKSTCRADIDEFTTKVRTIEDTESLEV